jgi:hypothetical protein
VPARNDGEPDPHLIRFCDWCHRWEREGCWIPLDLDDTAPGLVSHSICPDCAARVLSGELLPERQVDAEQAQRALEQAGRIARDLAELRPNDDDDDDDDDDEPSFRES